MKKLGLLFVMVISIVFTFSCISKEVPVTETYYETEYRTVNRTETYTTTEDVVVKTVEGSNTLNTKSQWKSSWVYLIQSGVWSTCYYGYDISTQEHTRSQIQISLGINPQINKGEIEVVNLTDACSDENIPNASWLFGKEPTQGVTGTFIPAEGCQLLGPQQLGMGGDSKTWVKGFNALVNEPARILGVFSIGFNKGDNIVFGTKGVKEFAILASVEPELRQPNVKLIWSDDIIEKKTVTKERQVPYQVPVQVEKQRTVIKNEKVPIWEIWKANPSMGAETPSPSPSTVLPEAPPVPSPKLIYNDDFSNPNSGWQQASSEEGESYYKDGEFHGIVSKWDWSGWQYNRNAGRFDDFTLEEDMRLVSGPKNSSYGLIFRCQDDDNFYRFLISANGSYLIDARLDGKWTELERWTMSPYINQNTGINHLKVTCKGQQIEVYVNGHYLSAVVDDSFANGYVGGIISTSEPNAHVAFDNLEVYSLD